MTFGLGNKSKAELTGVHPKLVAAVERAIILTTQDFAVHDGLRTNEEQRRYVKAGVSKTMDSKHLKQYSGFGHAVDLVPYINGKLRWEWNPIYHIAAAMQIAAQEADIELIWGGVWDRKLHELPNGAVGMKNAVSAYVERRLKAGKRAFIDGPHYELA